MFEPIPINDGQRSRRFQVFDGVSQPDLLVLDIMEATVSDDHVEIPARETRIVIERQNADDVLQSSGFLGVGLQRDESVLIDFVGVDNTALARPLGKEEGEVSGAGAYFTDSHSGLNIDQLDDLARPLPLVPVWVRRPLSVLVPNSARVLLDFLWRKILSRLDGDDRQQQ
jgi:hypothetical protein